MTGSYSPDTTELLEWAANHLTCPLCARPVSGARWGHVGMVVELEHCGHGEYRVRWSLVRAWSQGRRR